MKNAQIITKATNGQKVTPVSTYQPSKAVRDVTGMVMKDFILGETNMNTPRREFNDRSVSVEIDENQKAFNSYVPPRSEDPDLSWRAQTVRPITRNKLISIAAHITSKTIFPNVFAQNQRDDEDREAAQVMKDLMEYVIENSAYERVFIQAVIAALVDPAVIVNVEFAEVMRTVKWMKEDGTWTKQEIIDTVLSGFQMYVVPVKQILIANFYEPNIQKQRFVIRSKYIEYEEAKQIYGKKKSFTYVRPGVQAVFDKNTDSFYDVEDDNLPNLVHEVTYYNRSLDLQLTFLSGVLVCHEDYPNPRKDKLYPFAKGGYEPVGNGQCFYYKSAANKLGSDQEIVDTLYNMIIDGTFMALMPPLANYGSEEIGSSVYIPGSITDFKRADSKLEQLMPKADLRGGLETISKVEQSMAESSQDNMRAGVAQGGERTAREVLVLEQNARMQLGLFKGMISFLVEDIGKLIVGDILQYMTVVDLKGITTGEGEMHYRSYILPNKIEDGRKVTKKIEFIDPSMAPEIQSQDDAMVQSYKIMGEEGGPDADKKIYKVNPEVFRNITYRVRIDPDELNPKSSALEKALNLELYDRAIQNPNVDQEMVTRDFLFGSYVQGEVDKYMKKNAPVAQGGPSTPTPEAEGEGIMQGSMQGTELKQKGVNTNLVSQLTGGNSLGVAASSDM